MSFYFAFNGHDRGKLHELADQHLQYPNVPQAAVDFVKHAIDEYPDGTMLMVTAAGHKAHVNPTTDNHLYPAPSMIAATLDIKVLPIVPTLAPSDHNRADV